MKKKFRNFISWLLVVSIILPIATAFPTYADSFIDEESLEAMEDSESLIPERAGDWGKAMADKLVPPWNLFHNKVQKHIRDNNDPTVKPYELEIT